MVYFNRPDNEFFANLKYVDFFQQYAVVHVSSNGGVVPPIQDNQILLTDLSAMFTNKTIVLKRRSALARNSYIVRIAPVSIKSGEMWFKAMQCGGKKKILITTFRHLGPICLMWLLY